LNEIPNFIATVLGDIIIVSDNHLIGIDEVNECLHFFEINTFVNEQIKFQFL